MDRSRNRIGLLARIRRRLVDLVVGFVGPGPDSLRGHLNLGELLKVVAAAALAGYGLPEVLAAVLADLPRIVAPDHLALATAILTAILETVRRLRQGRTPPPPPPPSPPPASPAVSPFPRSI